MPTDTRRAIRRMLSVLVVLGCCQGCGGLTSSTDSSAAPASLAGTPQLKAAMELGSAQTLERSRKTKKAIEAYKRIVSEYPESPQAEIAREKLKALEGK
jgi:hypothetical protein